MANLKRCKVYRTHEDMMEAQKRELQKDEIRVACATTETQRRAAKKKVEDHKKFIAALERMGNRKRRNYADKMKIETDNEIDEQDE